MARFLRPFSRYGGSVSSPASRADCPLRVLFHYFNRFLTEYKSRFEKPYGFLRPIIKDVVERYLDCGNLRCGFARSAGCSLKASEVGQTSLRREGTVMKYIQRLPQRQAGRPDKRSIFSKTNCQI
jgi:hypothetical protein